MRKMSPTEQREAIKLLILLSHGNWQHGCPYGKARELVVKVLGLSDERPLDTKKRKNALNQFLADGGIF
jgi:hypothetical protein